MKGWPIASVIFLVFNSSYVWATVDDDDEGITEPSSSTTEGSDICEQLCKDGDGGALCTCSQPPARNIESLDIFGSHDFDPDAVNTELTCFKRCLSGKEKRSCDCDRILKTASLELISINCRILCQHGEGGALCNCPQSPARMTLERFPEVEKEPWHLRKRRYVCKKLCLLGKGEALCHCHGGSESTSLPIPPDISSPKVRNVDDPCLSLCKQGNESPVCSCENMLPQD